MPKCTRVFQLISSNSKKLELCECELYENETLRGFQARFNHHSGINVAFVYSGRLFSDCNETFGDASDAACYTVASNESAETIKELLRAIAAPPASENEAENDPNESDDEAPNNSPRFR